MDPAPVHSHAHYCNDNQQMSRSDTNKVGVWLQEPTFTYGLLYVAASMEGDHQHLHFALNKSDRRKTRNVVYEEIQHTGVVVSTPSEVPLAC